MITHGHENDNNGDTEPKQQFKLWNQKFAKALDQRAQMYYQENCDNPRFRLSFMQYLRLDVKFYEIVISQCRTIIKEQMVLRPSDVNLILSFEANGKELAQALAHRLKIQEQTLLNCDESSLNELTSHFGNLNILIIGDMLRSIDEINQFAQMISNKSYQKIVGCFMLFNNAKYDKKHLKFPVMFASNFNVDQQVQDLILSKKEHIFNFDSVDLNKLQTPIKSRNSVFTNQCSTQRVKKESDFDVSEGAESQSQFGSRKSFTAMKSVNRVSNLFDVNSQLISPSNYHEIKVNNFQVINDNYDSCDKEASVIDEGNYTSQSTQKTEPMEQYEVITKETHTHTMETDHNAIPVQSIMDNSESEDNDYSLRINPTQNHKQFTHSVISQYVEDGNNECQVQKTHSDVTLMNYENSMAFKDLGVPSDESDDEDIFWTKRLTFYQIGMEILPEKNSDYPDPEQVFKNKYARSNNPFIMRNSIIDVSRRLTLMPGIQMNKLLNKNASPDAHTKQLISDQSTQQSPRPFHMEKQSNIKIIAEQIRYTSDQQLQLIDISNQCIPQTPKKRSKSQAHVKFEPPQIVLDLKIDTKLKKIKRKIQEMLQNNYKISIFIITKKEQSVTPRPLTLEERDNQVWQHMSSRFFFIASIKVSIIIEQDVTTYIEINIDPRDSFKSLLDTLKQKHSEHYDTILDPDNLNKLICINKFKRQNDQEKKETMQSVVIQGELINQSLEQLCVINKSQIQLMQIQEIEEVQVEDASSSYGDETDDDTIFDQSLLTKDMVRDQKFTLKNLIKFLNIAIKGLKHVDDSDDLIMAIGNTGCGKSTLITSLLYGSDSLEEKILEVPIQVVQQDGTFKEKIKKEKVISVKESAKQEQGIEIEIGHSSSESMTFFPHFQKIQMQQPQDGGSEDSEGNRVMKDFLYADVAGLSDTNGTLVEFINMFIIKFIFQRVKRVRLLVPLTQVQITNNRGIGVREQLKTLQKICSSSLSNMVDSMIPILTKCNPKKVIDIEEIRSTLTDQMQSDIQSQAVSELFGKDYMNDNKNISKEERFRVLEEAMKEFASKIEIYDPLDREIFNEDEVNQTISREELMEEIVDLQPLVGSSLNVPLSEQMLSDLNGLLNTAEAQCTALAQDYINKAWNEGQSFINTFLHEEKVKIILDSLTLFADNNILAGIQER